MNRFELTLDLDKRGGVAQWVTLRQGDRRGTELRATIYDHGVQVGSGYTCRVVIRRPDVAEYYRETCEYSLGVATVTIDEQYAAAISGSTYGYFELLQGGSVIASTESFGVRILPDATADATVGPEYDSAIDDALAELDEATGRISQMVVDATEEYLEAHPELTTTVEDNSLTDAKLIQHGGILDRVARLMYRLDNLLTATPAESDSLTVTDAAKTPMAGLALYGRSTQDGTPTPSAPVAIQSVEAPNLAQPSYTTSGTTDSVAWTYLGDGVWKMDGTVSITSASMRSPKSFDLGVLPAGTYTVSCVRMGGTLSKGIIIRIGSGDSSSYYAGATASVDGTAAYNLTADGNTHYWATPQLQGGTVANGAIVAVMVTQDSTTCPYVPYQNVGLWAQGANLSPFFSVPIAAGGYWSADSANWTSTSDGWARFDFDNTSSSSANRDVIIYPQRQFHAGQRYTLLFEWRGVTVSGSSGSQLYTRTDDTYQFRGLGGNNRAIEAGSGSTSRTVTCGFDAEDATRMLGLRMRVVASTHVTGEWRVSIYNGEYAGGYQPYAESTTPIPLQGHALRSLPDGTRDEVTVDQYGRAVLVQRVGMFDVTALATSAWTKSGRALNGFYTHAIGVLDGGIALKSTQAGNVWCNIARGVSTTSEYFNNYSTTYIDNELNLNLDPSLVGSTVEEFKTWLAGHTVYLLGELTTPQTIDLGTIDPVALQGPDMTAQAVPTAPFALTYERDLNVTLARLEASIADAATA